MSVPSDIPDILREVAAFVRSSPVPVPFAPLPVRFPALRQFSDGRPGWLTRLFEQHVNALGLQMVKGDHGHFKLGISSGQNEAAALTPLGQAIQRLLEARTGQWVNYASMISQLRQTQAAALKAAGFNIAPGKVIRFEQFKNFLPSHVQIDQLNMRILQSPVAAAAVVPPATASRVVQLPRMNQRPHSQGQPAPPVAVNRGIASAGPAPSSRPSNGQPAPPAPRAVPARPAANPRTVLTAHQKLLLAPKGGLAVMNSSEDRPPAITVAIDQREGALCGTFIVVNSGNNERSLTEISFDRTLPLRIQFTPTRIVANGRTNISFRLIPTGTPPRPAEYSPVLLLFKFATFIIAHAARISMISGDIEEAMAHEELKAQEPYQRRNRRGDRRMFHNFDDGERPPWAAIPFVNRPGKWPLPHALQDSLEGARANGDFKDFEAAHALAGPLTLGDYTRRGHAMMFIEELAQLSALATFDLHSAFAPVGNGRLLSLQVPGLAESRPSVVVGDSIMVSRVPWEDTDPHTRLPRGFVHKVELNQIHISFPANFRTSYITGMKYFIRFKLNRGPLQRLHEATEMIAKNQQLYKPVLFPGASVAPSDYSFLDGVPIICTSNEAEANAWLAANARGANAVGLDCEARPGSSGVQPSLRLIQIATQSGILLFHVGNSDAPRALPASIINLLTSRNIIKYTVALAGDLDLLRTRCGGQPLDRNQFVDCQVGPHGLGHQPSLQRLTMAFVGVHLPKPEHIRWSSWAAPLSQEHIQYAAADAWATLQVGVALGAAQAAGVAPAGPDSNALSDAEFVVPEDFLAPPAAPVTLTGPAVRTGRGFSLNEDQQLALEQIVSRAHMPYPYIIFGPAGTGKSSALVATLKALFDKHNGNTKKEFRVLAVAPSNSAADLLARMLGPHYGGRGAVIRLNALTRPRGDIPDDVVPYSIFSGDAVTAPSLNALAAARLVVSTCASAGMMRGLGFTKAFQVIACDEAAHATEGDLMQALAGSMDSETAVLLVGDPRQLGPLILDKLADRNGWGISLLERLLQPGYQTHPTHMRHAVRRRQFTPYSRVLHGPNEAEPQRSQPFNPRYAVTLRHNYRSHPDILHVPNQLFYSNLLIPSADPQLSNSLLGHPIFSDARCAVQFVAVTGAEEQEKNSPSWFNRLECMKICDLVRSLLRDYRSSGLVANEIGILTPYRKQVEKIRRALELLNIENSQQITVGSAELFQGQERRVMLMSTVRSQVATYESVDRQYRLGFVGQPKRLNVALTRAKAGLIVVGNPNVLAIDPNWRAFMDYCRHRNSFMPRDFPMQSWAQQRDELERLAADRGDVGEAEVDNEDNEELVVEDSRALPDNTR